MASRTATTVIPYTELEVADGNFDTTRAPIDRIIIHTMVGTWQGAAARFDNPASQVSAHYGVGLDGKLYHWLEEFNTAYHAGDYPMNQRSIGIEHEDGWNGQPPEPTRPDALYETSAKLVRDICLFYNIPIDRDHIKKHNEVSDKPTGCPDSLDIDRIVRMANQSTPTPTPPAGGNMFTLPSGQQVDLSNADSMKVCATTWDEVVNLHQFVPVSDWNAVAALLGLPAGSTKDAVSSAIQALQKAKQTAETNNEQLTKQIPALTTRAETAEGKVTTLTQQLEDEKKLAQDDKGNSYKDLFNALEQDYNAKKAIWDAQFKKDVAVFSQLKLNNIYYLSTGTIFSYWIQRVTNQAKQAVPPPLTPGDFKYAESVNPPPNTTNGNSATPKK